MRKTWRYAATRLAHSVPVVFGVTVATFLVLHLIPGDPARKLAGSHAARPRSPRSAASSASMARCSASSPCSCPGSRLEGCFICAEGAAAVAALKPLTHAGWLGPDEEIVVVSTGAGLTGGPGTTSRTR